MVSPIFDPTPNRGTIPSPPKQGADIDPLLEQRSVDHRGGVNRVRSMPQQSSVVATWADTGHVHIWDVSSLVKAIDQPTGR